MTKGALSDLKVIEWGEFISAPYCAKLLADLGAEVIKIEAPGVGDEARRFGPFPGDVPHPEKSGLFLYCNTNKLGITLDVRKATGKKILLTLIKEADIFIENHPPQEMEKLDLDFESLKKINPKLIMTSLTPFGQTGPHRNYKATDLVSFHMGGYGYHITGAVDDPNSDPPLKPRGHHANFAAGITGAAATLSAVFARKKTDRGQHVDISEQEAQVPFVFGNVANYTYEGKGNNRSRSKNPPTGIVAVLPAKDGAVSISPRENHLWARWVEVMGNPEWAKDERFKDRASRVKHWSDLQPLIAEWTKEHPKDEIYRTAQAKRVPVFPVNTIEAVFQAEQFTARGFFKEIDHPVAGTLTYPTAPYQFSRTPWEVIKPAPLLGEHNEAILCQRLGYSKSDLVKLREGGII